MSDHSLNRRTLLSLLGAAALVPAGPAWAAGPHRGAVSPDRYRLMALMGGSFAIATSELALERARIPTLRTFARLEINEQVAVAGSLGARPGAAGLRPDQAALVEELAATPPGPRFDRLYLQGQVAGHRELLALNRAYAQGGRDDLGRAVANVAVPSIETHLTILSRIGRG